MRMPKKLITTMGIELTFVPSIYDLINEREPGAVSQARYDSCSLRIAYSELMGAVLSKRGVRVHDCGTDPDCVEVPTLPYDDSKELMRACKQIHDAADVCMLQPYSTQTRGGGAHIHAGKIGKGDEQRAVTAHVMAWAAANPWLAWAHAIPCDTSNANPLCREEVHMSMAQTVAYKYAASVRSVISNANELERAKRELGDAVMGSHTVRGWCISEQGENDYYDTRYYRRQVMRHRRYLCAALQEFYRASAAYMHHINNPDDDRVRVADIEAYSYKDRAVVDRGDTIEFRCFTMPWDYKGHTKQVMLVNNILKLAQENASDKDNGNFIDYPMLSAQQINSMKYSEAKRGFNAMLESLNLDPEEYRAERVNIAVRFRQLRQQRATQARDEATRAI